MSKIRPVSTGKHPEFQAQESYTSLSATPATPRTPNTPRTPRARVSELGFHPERISGLPRSSISSGHAYNSPGNVGSTPSRASRIPKPMSSSTATPTAVASPSKVPRLSVPVPGTVHRSQLQQQIQMQMQTQTQTPRRAGKYQHRQSGSVSLGVSLDQGYRSGMGKEKETVLKGQNQRKSWGGVGSPGFSGSNFELASSPSPSPLRPWRYSSPSLPNPHHDPASPSKTPTPTSSSITISTSTPKPRQSQFHSQHVTIMAQTTPKTASTGILPSFTPKPKPTPTPPRAFVKSDPRVVLRHLCDILEPDEWLELRRFLEIDVLLALHEREGMEGKVRLLRERSSEGSTGKGSLDVFGCPLRQISLYASTKAILGGYEHELPILVFACVEELYRSGLSTILDLGDSISDTCSSSSATSFTHSLDSTPQHPPPSSPHRIPTLVEVFNSPKHKFGFYTSLARERPGDVYTLLETFLSQLPEPVMAPMEIETGLREAIWMFCVCPGAKSKTKLDSWAERQYGHWYEGEGRGFSSLNGTADAGDSSKATTVKANLNLYDPQKRIRIARLLLRLIPSPNLSLFVYLMAFACQVYEACVRREDEDEKEDEKEGGRGAGVDVCTGGGGEIREDTDDVKGVGEVKDLTSIEAQLIKLEREIEGERVRERVRGKVGRVFGGWMFGTDEDLDVREREREEFVYVVEGESQNEDGDGTRGRRRRSMKMMIWFLDHWGEIIRGFFEDRDFSGLAFDVSGMALPRPVLGQGEGSVVKRERVGARDEGDEGRNGLSWDKDLGGVMLLKEPKMITLTEEDLLSSSPSFFSMANGVGVSQGGDEEDECGGVGEGAIGDGDGGGRVRVGLVRGKSYGEATHGSAPSSEAASVHSGGEPDSNSDQRREPQAQAPNMSSTTSFASALDERLLDAESDDELVYLHLPAMPLPGGLPRVGSGDFRPVHDTRTPSSSSSAADAVKGKGESSSRASSVYSDRDCDQEDELDGMDERPSTLRVVNWSETDSPVESSMNTLEDRVDRVEGGPRLCERCDEKCVAHWLVKELEKRVEVLRKERDEALGLGLGLGFVRRGRGSLKEV